MEGQMAFGDPVDPVGAVSRRERYAEAAAARDEAMERVERNATEEAKAALAECLSICIRLGREFTSDDVWEWMDRKFAHVEMREPRLLGPIMRAASRAGRIEKTGRTRDSIRKETHMNPKAIWRVRS